MSLDRRQFLRRSGAAALSAGALGAAPGAAVAADAGIANPDVADADVARSVSETRSKNSMSILMMRHTCSSR